MTFGKRAALLGLAWLAAQARAAPLDDSAGQQATIGFDPKTYVYLAGDYIPPDGPGPAPDVSDHADDYDPSSPPPPGPPPPALPSDTVLKRDSDDEDEPSQTEDPGPLVWLERTRPNHQPAVTPDVNDRIDIRRGIQEYLARAQRSPEAGLHDTLQLNNFDGTEPRFSVDLVWYNRDHHAFGLLTNPNPRPITTYPVQRNLEDAPAQPQTLDEWLQRRIDSGATEGYSGLIVLGNRAVVFAYRVWLIRELEIELETDRAAIRQGQQAGRNPQPQQQQSAGEAPPPELVGRTSFGSPIVNLTLPGPPPPPPKNQKPPPGSRVSFSPLGTPKHEPDLGLSAVVAAICLVLLTIGSP